MAKRTSGPEPVTRGIEEPPGEEGFQERRWAQGTVQGHPCRFRGQEALVQFGVLLPLHPTLTPHLSLVPESSGDREDGKGLFPQPLWDSGNPKLTLALGK